MPGVVYVGSSVLGVVMLGLSGFCTSNAGRNHLSPWWLGTYATLVTAFVLVAAQTAGMAGAVP